MGNMTYLCGVRRFRSIETYKHYFEEFFGNQKEKVRDKIVWTFQLIEEHERVPKTYFDHLEDGIYEIRVKLGSNIYRILSFFDHDKLIIAINSFQKKTQKTPRNQIKKAKIIREEYEREKEQHQNT